MEYNHIVDPISGKKVNLFGNQGKKIINNYLNILQHGGNVCNGLKKAPCIEHKECEWGMPTGKKPNRCHVAKSDEPGAVNPATVPVLVKPTKKPTISKKTKKSGKTTPSTKPTSNQCMEATSENGFTPSQVKKYQNRPSPPYPATDCAGKLMLGQGKGASTIYESVPRGKSYVWVKAKINPAVQPLREEKPTPVAAKPVKKSVVTESPKKTIAAKTKTDKPKINKPESTDCIEATLENGFTPSQVKKYQGRPSPPYPAANCAGEEMYGQGKGANTLYKSVPRGKSYAWAKV